MSQVTDDNGDIFDALVATHNEEMQQEETTFHSPELAEGEKQDEGDFGRAGGQ